MGGSPPSPPPPPDPRVTAGAQTAQNVLSAVANQYGSLVNLNSPFGTVNYAQTGTLDETDPNSNQVYHIPGYTQTVNLSDQGNQLLTNTLGTQNLAGQQAQQILQNADYTSVPDPVGDNTKGLTKNLIDQNVAYLQPLQQQAHDRLKTQLENSGITEFGTHGGTNPAYIAAMRDLSDQQARDNNQMIIGSQGQAFNEAQANYLRPLQISQALYPTGNPVSPSMIQTPQGNYNQQTTNYAGIVNSAYQNQMQGYQAQLQASGANNAALGGGISSLARIFMGGLG